MTMTIASILECNLSIFQVPPFSPCVDTLNERPITTSHIPKANYPILSCLLYYYICELIYYTTMYIQCIYITYIPRQLDDEQVLPPTSASSAAPVPPRSPTTPQHE